MCLIIPPEHGVRPLWAECVFCSSLDVILYQHDGGTRRFSPLEWLE